MDINYYIAAYGIGGKQVTIFDKPLEVDHEKDTKHGSSSLFRHPPAVTSEPTKAGNR